MENNQNASLQVEVTAPVAQPAPDETTLRAQELVTQAKTIREVSGVDVMAIYSTDVEVRGRVLSGEWDFVDVWKHSSRQPQPPARVRSANGGVGSVRITAMDSDQFSKLNQLLSRGGKVDMTL